MARRTKAEALVTRDHILDAAERVFEQHGVSGTSLNDIAQAANLTRGAIYWHFENKADLFHAMMQRVILPLEEAAQRAADASTVDPIEQVRSRFIETLTRTAQDPQLRRVFEIATHKVEFVDEMRVLRERKLATRNNWLKQMESGVAQAVEQGQLRGTPAPPVAALGVYALIDGLIRNWTLDPSAFDLLDVGTQVLDTYLVGLGRPARPARPPDPPAVPAATQRKPRQRTTP